jgi:hypothetical protein
MIRRRGGQVRSNDGGVAGVQRDGAADDRKSPSGLIRLPRSSSRGWVRLPVIPPTMASVVA